MTAVAADVLLNSRSTLGAEATRNNDRCNVVRPRDRRTWPSCRHAKSPPGQCTIRRTLDETATPYRPAFNPELRSSVAIFPIAWSNSRYVVWRLSRPSRSMMATSCGNSFACRCKISVIFIEKPLSEHRVTAKRNRVTIRHPLHVGRFSDQRMDCHSENLRQQHVDGLPRAAPAQTGVSRRGNTPNVLMITVSIGSPRSACSRSGIGEKKPDHLLIAPQAKSNP